MVDDAMGCAIEMNLDYVCDPTALLGPRERNASSDSLRESIELFTWKTSVAFRVG